MTLQEQETLQDYTRACTPNTPKMADNNTVTKITELYANRKFPYRILLYKTALFFDVRLQSFPPRVINDWNSLL